MVKVISYSERQNSSGESFYALILQGDVELVQSKETGNFYATARTASIPSTFDRDTCEELVNQLIPGSIVQVPCEPFEYMVPGSEETVTLEHTYKYSPHDKEVQVDVLSEEVQVF